MGAIFISYRREDSEGQAGRLFEDLCARFGSDAVFMDVVGIEPGQDFRAVIDTKVAACSVLLALIGRQWLTTRDPSGRRRIDDPADFVRLETASALQRGVTVIPVLVQGARMPAAADLPADLQNLAFRNAVELTHARWPSDLGLLMATLQRLGFEAQDGGAEVPPTPSAGSRGARRVDGRRRSRWVVAGVLSACVLGAGTWWLLDRADAQQQADEASRAALQKTLADARESLASTTTVLAQTMAQLQEREAAAQRLADAEQAARAEREAAERALEAARTLQQENERLRQEALARRNAEQAEAARRQAEEARAAATQREQALREAALRESQAREAAARATAQQSAAATSVKLQMTAAKDAARRLQQGFGTDGPRVTAVEYAQAAGGPPAGAFRRTGPLAWTELNASGQATFRFAETHRDAWSVYLHDASRNVRIQLDLYTRRVNYSDGANPAPRKLYDLVDAR